MVRPLAGIVLPLAYLLLLPAAPAGAARTRAATACRVEPASAARTIAELPLGRAVQLLAMRGDWAMVRAEGSQPCWMPTHAIQQVSADARAVTRYDAVTLPAGGVAIAPASGSDRNGDCSCSTGRTCQGPAGNRYCISRGILTTRTR